MGTKPPRPGLAASARVAVDSDASSAADARSTAVTSRIVLLRS